jgi:insertion element IS1 protein InsB
VHEPRDAILIACPGFGVHYKQHTVGKRYLQKIERKHLTFRTRLKRLARQTLCFSRSIAMHDVVIGLFINRYEFGIEV